MIAPIFWILIGAATSGYTAPVPLAKYRTEAACKAAADDLYKRSSERSRMPNLNGICIQTGGEQ